MRNKLFLAALICLSISCQNPKPKQAVSAVASVDSLFREYNAFKMRINPIESTKAGETMYNDRVENYISDPYQRDLIENYSAFAKAASAYDSTELTPSQWLSLGVLKWDCEIKLEGLQDSLVSIASPMFDMPSMELTPIMQIQSLHLYMSQLAGGKSLQPFNTVKDYENWLHRIDDFLPFIDTAIVKMKEGITRKVVLPKVIIERMIPQVQNFVKLPAEQNLFYSPVGLMPANFSEADKQRLTTAYEEMITTKLVPKYNTLLDFLRNTYLPAGRATHGISAVPHGTRAFNHLIRYFTTTGMTAAEIHELGKKEVERIGAEMEKVKSQLGFKGDMKSFCDFVRADKNQMPFSAPEQVIANFNAIHDRIKPKLNELFDLKPKGQFEVRRTEAFREASASAEFLPGNKDGSRPGIFYVPIPDVKRYNKFADEALFLHEAIPGHYHQLTLQQENNELPEFLHPESISVFVEGWALYAESLGKELGLYEDPYQYFGMLSMEMHRAIRLVLETGIHTMGWTREQAIAYSLAHEAESPEKIAVEVERYIATPGAALCYKVGQLKIRELRTRAEQILGDKFSIKEFHNQVLNSGSLPLMLLEKKINAWIAKTQRG